MNDDLAKQRFVFLNLIRLGSVALVLFGLVVAGGRTGMPPLAGAVVALAGMAEFFFLPRYLARRWKSPPR